MTTEVRSPFTFGGIAIALAVTLARDRFRNWEQPRSRPCRG